MVINNSLKASLIKLIYIKTFGCSLNLSDSELMAGLLQDAGFEVIIDESLLTTTNINKIELVLINTCTVKNLAENKFWKELEKWQKLKKKIIVAGCIPQAEPDILNNKLKDVSVIGTSQLTQILKMVIETINGKIIHNIDKNIEIKYKRLNFPKIRKNKIIEIIPICEGCLGNCSYCKTKHARGNLISYPKEEIIQQAKQAIAEGCKELWITSQDNGCYGFDNYKNEKYFLPSLLKDILALEGEFRIRLGMCNPNHIIKIKKELIQVFKHPKMFKFLHIPVQAGNNRILKLMNRAYSVEDFKDIVEEFRKEIPEITISTDIIVGFPEETEKEFKESVALIKRIIPDVLNFSRFWIRKGTSAEKMNQVHGKLSKIRSQTIKDEFDKIIVEKNKKLIGKVYSVLIDDYALYDALGTRNDFYKSIIIKKDSILAGKKYVKTSLTLGKFVKVKIIGIGKYDLRGELL